MPKSSRPRKGYRPRQIHLPVSAGFVATIDDAWRDIETSMRLYHDGVPVAYGEVFDCAADMLNVVGTKTMELFKPTDAEYIAIKSAMLWLEASRKRITKEGIDACRYAVEIMKANVGRLSLDGIYTRMVQNRIAQEAMR